MSRSKRKPYYYHRYSENPSKESTSRWLRRKLRQLLHIEKEEFVFFDNIMDNNRGEYLHSKHDDKWDTVVRWNPYLKHEDREGWDEKEVAKFERK